MIGVSTRKVIARINRQLVPDGARIRVTRGINPDLGAFYVTDQDQLMLVKLDNAAELETYARELGCLAANEEVQL